MALFSQEQLKQFQALLKPLDARLSDIDKQQGEMWETSVRQSMRDQFGHSFSKEFTIASLQHLASIICRSVGWPFGSTLWTSVASRATCQPAAGTSRCRQLPSVHSAALVNSTDGKGAFSEFGEQLKQDPWFDTAGKLDKAAIGRSLPAFDEEETKHLKSKLQKVHRLVTQEDHKGQVSHLLTCRSGGLMLALYAAELTKYRTEHSTLLWNLTHSLPFLQLQNGRPWENYHDQQ